MSKASVAFAMAKRIKELNDRVKRMKSEVRGIRNMSDDEWMGLAQEEFSDAMGREEKKLRKLYKQLDDIADDMIRAGYDFLREESSG